jgi:putative addiction module killer protein
MKNINNSIIILTSAKYKTTAIFDKWIESLPDNVNEKIWVFINRLIAGNVSNCKTVREGISEIRIKYQKGYRVFFTMSKGTIIILLAGADKSGNQKQQDKVIQKAIDLKNQLKKDGKL